MLVVPSININKHTDEQQTPADPAKNPPETAKTDPPGTRLDLPPWEYWPKKPKPKQKPLQINEKMLALIDPRLRIVEQNTWNIVIYSPGVVTDELRRALERNESRHISITRRPEFSTA
ncbi:hypothetical protein [Methylocaldum szegediense]|nr:hypothetical protein [Methylocaldum szegediense]